MSLSKKTIRGLVGKFGLKFKGKAKASASDTFKEKGPRPMRMTDDTKRHVVKRIAAGESQVELAKQVEVCAGSINRIKDAKQRHFIGETDGATILKKELLENAIIASEVVRSKVEDLGAKDAAIVMGIATSNYLAMKAKTDGDVVQVSPHEIVSLAASLSKFRQLANQVPLVEAESFELRATREVFLPVIEVTKGDARPDK